MKILFDSVYVHNGGGKEILDLIIHELIKGEVENNFHFLLDKRYVIPKSANNKLDFTSILSSESNRKRFYIDNKGFKSYFCFGNVPPPISINNPCSIYFHNDLLTNPFGTNLSLKDIFKNLFKKYYIKIKSHRNYIWCVQTNIMRRKLSNAYWIDEEKIKIYPIFDNNIIHENRTNDSFLYVSNYSKHKNHNRLLKAFIESANSTNKTLILKLTLTDKDYEKSIYKTCKLPKNLIIKNLGILNKQMLRDAYLNSKFLIFPSLNESFGLPLIEATNMGCYTVASALDYVDEIISPSIKFDPFSITDISKAILECVNNRTLDPSKPIIENKIDIFVKYLTSNV
tara:strand:- start:1404 stop:2426 length:1023 start_codon:yes stop_codon:yes gene_type:complete